MPAPLVRCAAYASVLGTLLSLSSACLIAQREVGDRLRDFTPSPWTSRQACEEQTPPLVSADHPPRIGTWNILYFPDADEDQEEGEDGTDIDWLACTIAGLNVDLLAVQEIKTTARSADKQAELVARLNEWTGGDWQFALASCKPSNVQHPGFLFDRSRVKASQLRDIPELNGGAECTNRLSPGYAGYFEFTNGPDLHLVAVHLEAYPEERSLESRARSVSVLGEVAQDAFALVPDSDIIFAGDFNTTGCDDCDKKLSAQQELEQLRSRVTALEPPLLLRDASLSCSKPGAPLMDHFVTDVEMGELAPGALAQVRGICEETMCSRLREWHEDATEAVSDHCPLTLDLMATDDDP